MQQTFQLNWRNRPSARELLNLVEVAGEAVPVYTPTLLEVDGQREERLHRIGMYPEDPRWSNVDWKNLW